jgi:predicted Zn-dependent protease
MADRYSYLPSIGIFIAAVWGIGDLLEKIRLMPAAARSVPAVLAVASLVTFSIVARQQVWYWKDTETLFTHALQVTGPNPIACYAIGAAAYARGDLQTAVQNLTIVIEQDPGNDKAMQLMGDIWLRLFDLKKAAEYYSHAVDLKPRRADYRIKLAFTLAQQGDPAALESAVVELRQALQIDPANPQAAAGLIDVQARLKTRKPLP